ncbi:uncharacterized protein SPSK_06599 [Sporothrix schenckii 1099-18]|uniref:CCD97-like C-terminal domain-containing protein n=1 Tax=Sporothrix schenckii 1099-18 TaxID=1397361 RepID=A0A0F2MLG7_SPOSC|nr:uncharacterized protein SPSK_06599 [Sporothrix schenckii 1099-18]KJR89685.1 hypothetical protein SPSK_06599 [Sporothrix schenckii 1099-18]
MDPEPIPVPAPALEHTLETAPTTSQPRPRPDRSSEQARRVRTKNRRLEFLRRHPEYLASSDREFANVALYNTLVRSFQTPAERAAEAQDSGFGHVLEASMLRNPEPLHRVDDDEVEEEEDDDDVAAPAAEAQHEKDDAIDELNTLHPDFDPDPSLDVAPRDAALRRWHTFVRNWFVDGGAALDDGFDYAAVDDDSEYDALARADAEAAWFDEESPGWASDEEGDGKKKEKTGETGIQDF